MEESKATFWQLFADGDPTVCRRSSHGNIMTSFDVFSVSPLPLSGALDSLKFNYATALQKTAEPIETPFGSLWTWVGPMECALAQPGEYH